MKRNFIRERINEVISWRKFVIERIKRRSKLILFVIHVDKRTVQASSLIER